jgi:heptosyltransferase-2
MKARLIPRDAVERVLVRLPNWLGDTVMAQPLLRSLRRAVPDAELWCLGPWVTTVLESEPGITRRLLPPKSTGARLAQARRLRQARFDLALIVPNSFETALAGWLCGARWRVGYAADARDLLLTHGLRRDAGPIHEVATYLRLLAPLGVDDPSGTPHLTIDPARRSEARRLVAEAGLTPGRPRVGLQLGAAFGPSKLWPPERIGLLARRLEARGIDTLLLGRAGEKELEEVARTAAGVPGRSLVGRDRPALLAALMAELDAVVAADSGPAHVAAAVGVPTVTLFGPTDPRLTAPLGAEQRAIWRQPACSPCFLRECPIDHRCLRAIEVDEVETAVVAALATRR